MPYLTDDLKRSLKDGKLPDSGGELNYLITELVFDYWTRYRKYKAINDVLGALEGAKLEFYRRVAAPYEDSKIKSNGDVYVDAEAPGDIGEKSMCLGGNN